MGMQMNQGVEEYQCLGCISGSDTNCGSYKNSGDGCRAHCPGTTALGNGFTIALGLPRGFHRIGHLSFSQKSTVRVFETFDIANRQWKYGKFNAPVWAHLDENGNTLVRMFQPRLAYSEVHVILEDCVDRLNPMYVLSAEELKEMD